MGEKMIFVGVWLERWNEKKLVGPMVLFLWAHQKLILPIVGGKGLNGKWLIYSYYAHVSLTWLAFIYYFKTLILTIHASYYSTMNTLFCFVFSFFFISNGKILNYYYGQWKMEEKNGERIWILYVFGWRDDRRENWRAQGVFSPNLPKIDPPNLGPVWMEKF